MQEEYEKQQSQINLLQDIIEDLLFRVMKELDHNNIPSLLIQYYGLPDGKQQEFQIESKITTESSSNQEQKDIEQVFNQKHAYKKLIELCLQQQIDQEEMDKRSHYLIIINYVLSPILKDLYSLRRVLYDGQSILDKTIDSINKMIQQIQDEDKLGKSLKDCLGSIVKHIKSYGNDIISIHNEQNTYKEELKKRMRNKRNN